MLLHALDALYGRLKDDPSYLVPRSRYSIQKITFKVVLTPAGELFEIQDARQPVDRRLRPMQLEVPGDTKSSGKGLNPGFLWDNSEYLLGVKPDGEKPKRTAAAFAAFREKHLAVEREIHCKSFSAVCRFLESWDPARAQDHGVLEDAASTGFGVFQIQGQPAFVHEDLPIAKWWAEQGHEDKGADEAQCLVTGKTGHIARLHRKIRGVRGAQAAGAAIVGFNEDAYESYGKHQSYNAPVSEGVAFRYVTALNALLDGPKRTKHRLTIGDTTVAFWTDRPSVTEDIFLAFATEGSDGMEKGAPQDEGLRAKLGAFLHALREGREAYGRLQDDPDRTQFFFLGLSPNAARISVRFFHHATLGGLLDNLRRHHRDIAVDAQWPSDREFPPIWLLLRQTAREPNDIPPILAGPLLQAIVAGEPYPRVLFSATLRRIRADRQLNYLRACVVKGFLNRNCNQGVTMSLDPERTDPAYRLGRLFAAFEKTQEDALGGQLGKTIRDSFYGSASATPRWVFPRLLRTYGHHLAKLEGGRKVNREKLIQGIVEPLRDFPAHLDLAGQGLFAIGYYHQRLAFFAKGKDPREKGQANEENS